MSDDKLQAMRATEELVMQMRRQAVIMNAVLAASKDAIDDAIRTVIAHTIEIVDKLNEEELLDEY